MSITETVICFVTQRSIPCGPTIYQRGYYSMKYRMKFWKLRKLWNRLRGKKPTLKGVWTVESVDELYIQHGLHVEEELVEILKEEILKSKEKTSERNS
jgi:hypothetical protein